MGGQGSFCRYLAEGLTRLGHEMVVVGEAGKGECHKLLRAKLVAKLAVSCSPLEHLESADGTALLSPMVPRPARGLGRDAEARPDILPRGQP
jgi:hypothetical protein